MNFRKSASYFFGIALLTFLVSAVVTYLYSLIVHKAGTVDWETAFRLAFILGIVLTWIYTANNKE